MNRTIGRIVIPFFIISIGCFNNTYAQLSGDAVRFFNGSYYNCEIPVDSLGACSIELWVKPTQNIDAGYLFYIGESDTAGFGLFETTLAGSLFQYAEIKLGGVIESATGNQARLPLNMWTHLAVTRSGNEWKFYKNGSLVGRGNHTPKIVSSAIVIGKGITGDVDEITW